MLNSKHRGGSRIFMGPGGGGGGGSAKDCDMPARTLLQARNRTHFRQGSRARLKKNSTTGLT